MFYLAVAAGLEIPHQRFFFAIFFLCDAPVSNEAQYSPSNF